VISFDRGIILRIGSLVKECPTFEISWMTFKNKRFKKWMRILDHQEIAIGGQYVGR
jgi:hypothetical protein